MKKDNISFGYESLLMDTNRIGDIGEMTTSIRIMEDGLFSVICIGGKTPAFDLLCEIVPQNVNEKPYQFLVQVKSTNAVNPYTMKNRIKTPITQVQLSHLVDRPLPTYVAGVDLQNDAVYISAAFDIGCGYGGSIPTKYELKKNNSQNIAILTRLKNDVINYWRKLNIDVYKSTFKSKLL